MPSLRSVFATVSISGSYFSPTNSFPRYFSAGSSLIPNTFSASFVAIIICSPATSYTPYSNFGETASARFAGNVQGVVVQASKNFSSFSILNFTYAEGSVTVWYASLSILTSAFETGVQNFVSYIKTLRPS